MKKQVYLGQVEHSKKVETHKGDRLQTDTLTTRIPMDLINEEGQALLRYWRVDLFDNAYIDFETDEIVIECVAGHFLPKAYIEEED